MIGVAFWFAGEIAAGALFWTVWVNRTRIARALRGGESSRSGLRPKV